MRRSYALSVQGWPRIRVGGGGRASDGTFQVGGRVEETHTPRGTPWGRAQAEGEGGQREGGRRL